MRDIRTSRYTLHIPPPQYDFPERPAVMCFPAKAGCSRWSMLVRRVQTGTLHPEKNIHSWWSTDRANFPVPVRGQQLVELFANSAVPRFLITRNPYSRLLSAFNEKCKKAALEGRKTNICMIDTRSCPAYGATANWTERFDIFVRALHRTVKRQERRRKMNQNGGRYTGQICIWRPRGSRGPQIKRAH